MNNALWDYSCAVYRDASVASLCLALQDEAGVDINVLLYGAWLGSHTKPLAAEHLEGLEARIVAWRQDIVWPLRRLRRNFRDVAGDSPAYDDIKALELSAEQQQQQLMTAYLSDHPIAPAADVSVSANLRRVAAFYAPDATHWNESLTRLSELLSA